MQNIISQRTSKAYADYIIKYNVIFSGKNNSVFVIFMFKILAKR